MFGGDPMRFSWLGVFVVLCSAAGDAAEENLVFKELLDKGVAMSDGTAVKLPAPTLADGLDAAHQKAVLGPLGGANHPLDDLTRKSLVAPFVLNIRTVKTTNPKAPARTVDLWFFAHGDWTTLNSNDFVEGLFKPREQPATAEARVAKTGSLTAAEVAKRGIPPLTVGPNYEERFFYSTANMFDKVEIGSTRYTVFNRYRDSLVQAARIDSRFNSDTQYPNQWRPLTRQEDGSLVAGSPQPYTQSGFYVKATRILDPADAILIEYHMVFEEPYAWFEGANLLSSKLPLLAQDEVRNFRRRLLDASKPGPTK
jgi:hypothetical protein